MIELLKISIFKTSKDQSGIEHPLNSFRSTEALESFRKHITEVLIGKVRRLGDNEQITVDLVTREKPDGKVPD